MFQENSGIIQAEIISIGNEVISGLIQDSNSRYLSDRLQAEGIDVCRITAVGDEEKAIIDAVSGALERVGVIITTGGLGSTHDDITKQVLAKKFQSGFKKDTKVEALVRKIYKARGREVPGGFLEKCRVPDNAVILYNSKGTAPGLLFQKGEKKIYSLPGIPLEMKYLFEKYIQPDLEKMKTLKIGHRILKTTGITETDLWSQIGSLAPLQEWVTVASLPSHLGVKIRLSALGESREETQSKLDKAEKMVAGKIGSYIYGMDDETLEERVGKLLNEKSRTLAVAESCTGGLIGHRLTQVSGSSNYFLEGAITYSNEAKQNRLGVARDLLDQYGAVSRETALAMTEGIRNISGADIGLAVTGIAGPTGGTEEKPVGLTFIAVSDAKNSLCRKFQFHQDRTRNKERAAQAALNLLRLWLLETPLK